MPLCFYVPITPKIMLADCKMAMNTLYNMCYPYVGTNYFQYTEHPLGPRWLLFYCGSLHVMTDDRLMVKLHGKHYLLTVFHFHCICIHLERFSHDDLS